MTVTGLIKFTQGPHTDVPGNAVFGTLTDGPVTFQKDPASTGTTFAWSMIDVPPGSAIPLGPITTASSGSFPQPDVTGGYLLQLVESDGTTTVTTQLCLGVKDVSGRFRPSFKAIDKALTFGGQVRGWATYMEQWFSFMDGIISSISALFLANNLAAATVANWYVDAAAGNDANDGKTPGTAFATSEKLQSTICPGGTQCVAQQNTTYHFAAGAYGKFTPNLDVPAGSGFTITVAGTFTSGAPITLGSVTNTVVSPSAPVRGELVASSGTFTVANKRIRSTSGVNAGAITYATTVNSPTDVFVKQWQIGLNSVTVAPGTTCVEDTLQTTFEEFRIRIGSRDGHYNINDIIASNGDSFEQPSLHGSSTIVFNGCEIGSAIARCAGNVDYISCKFPAPTSVFYGDYQPIMLGCLFLGQVIAFDAHSCPSFFRGNCFNGGNLFLGSGTGAATTSYGVAGLDGDVEWTNGSGTAITVQSGQLGVLGQQYGFGTPYAVGVAVSGGAGVVTNSAALLNIPATQQLTLAGQNHNYAEIPIVLTRAKCGVSLFSDPTSPSISNLPNTHQIFVDSNFAGISDGSIAAPYTSNTAAIAAAPASGAVLIQMPFSNVTENVAIPGTGNWEIMGLSPATRPTINGNITLAPSVANLSSRFTNVHITGNVGGNTASPNTYCVLTNALIDGNVNLTQSGAGVWTLLDRGIGQTSDSNFSSRILGTTNVAGSLFAGRWIFVGAITTTGSFEYRDCSFGGASVFNLGGGSGFIVDSDFAAAPTFNGPGTVNIDGYSHAKAGAFTVSAGAVVNLLNDVSFASVNAALATANASIAINAQKITNALDPTNPQDLATKNYVDAVAQGLSVKPSVVALENAVNVAMLSGTAQTAGGVALNTVGMRVALGAQTTGSQDGIYVVQAGPWTRATDLPAGSHAAGIFFFVEQGTNANSGFVCADAPGSDVVGTNALTFTQFSGAGEITAGNGLTKSGNTLSALAGPDGSVAVSGTGIAVGILATDVQHGNRGGGALHALAVASGAAGFMSGADKASLNNLTAPAGVQTGDLAVWDGAKYSPIPGAPHQAIIGNGSGYVKTLIINVDDNAGTILTLFDVQDVGVSRFSVDLNGVATAKQSVVVNTAGGSFLGVGDTSFRSGTPISGVAGNATFAGANGQAGNNGGWAWLAGGNATGGGVGGNAILGGVDGATSPITNFQGMAGGIWIPVATAAPTAAPAAGAFMWFDSGSGNVKAWKAGAGAPVVVF